MDKKLIASLLFIFFQTIYADVHDLDFPSTTDNEEHQSPLETTRWRYVNPITSETTVLDISKPQDIQLCLDNNDIKINFDVTMQKCNERKSETQSISKGCSSFGSVRKVTIKNSKNPKVFAAGGTIKHINFDIDEALSKVDRSKKHYWSYILGNTTDIYKDPDSAARILRVCVAKGAYENGWGVNFKTKGHPCNPNKINDITITGVVNEKYKVKSACAIIETSEIWIDGSNNPGGSAKGTYEFMR